MSIVRVGIAGISGIGGKYARWILEGSIQGLTLTAVCSGSEKGKALAAQNWPEIPYFGDYGQMIESGLLDAVIIATPHYLHPPMAIAAFEKGLHVLVDKPAGVYTEQVIEMNKAAQHSGKVFSIMFHQRANGPFAALKKLVESGELGAITRRIWIDTASYRTDAYYRSSPWRATYKGEGGGVLINQAAHSLDMWQWLFGMPQRVEAKCGFGRYHNIEVEDDVTAYLEYADGSLGHYIASTGDAPGSNRLEISCENGRVVLEDGQLTFTKSCMPKSEFNRTCTDPLLKPTYERIAIPFEETPNPYLPVMQNFADVILKGAENGWSGVDGYRSVELCNAMVLSAWLGHPISLPIDGFLYKTMLEEHIK